MFAVSNYVRYVPSYIFGEKAYPNYLSGTGYVMSTDIIADLLRMAETTPFFHLEDIYITGNFLFCKFLFTSALSRRYRSKQNAERKYYSQYVCTY